MGDLDLFWFLWVLTLVSIIYAIVSNYNKGKFLYGFPLLAGLMFAYFYLFQSYFVAVNFSYIFEPWMLELGQAMALISFLALMLGWHLGYKLKPMKEKKGGRRYSSINYDRLWKFGVIVTLIAIVSIQIFKQSYDWEGTSAYWYLLFHIGYPGILACVIAIVKDPQYQTFRHKLFLGILAVALTYTFFLAARRGPVFPLVIFLVYGFGLFANRKPRKLILIISLGLITSAMLIFPFVRDYSNEYMTAWSDDTLATLSWEKVTVGKASTEADNEFFYHVATIATSYEYDNYQYGTGYLSLLFHWIPRSLWPEKPRLGEGAYIWTPSLVHILLHLDLSSGASAGGVADSFMEVGFMAPLIWMLIAFLMAKLFVGIYSDDFIFKPAQYVAILASTHWLISQGLAAAFVPMLIYVVTITVLIKLSLERSQKPSDNLP